MHYVTRGPTSWQSVLTSSLVLLFALQHSAARAGLQRASLAGALQPRRGEYKKRYLN